MQALTVHVHANNRQRSVCVANINIDRRLLPDDHTRRLALCAARYGRSNGPEAASRDPSASADIHVLV